jgi:hypothetical protein
VRKKETVLSKLNIFLKIACTAAFLTEDEVNEAGVDNVLPDSPASFH